jgi:hypothetical protein
LDVLFSIDKGYWFHCSRRKRKIKDRLTIL